MENNVAHILNNLTPKEKAKIIAVEKAKIEKSEKIAKLEAEFNLLKDEIEKIKGQKSKIEERIQTREAKIKILENPNTQDQTKIIKAEEGVTNSDKLESLILGKIVYHNFKKVRKGNKEITNEIPNDLAYSTSKNAGYDSYASWNPEKKNFYIESENTEGLNKIAEEINKISKESNLDMPLEKKGFGLYGNIGNLTEEEFIKIIEGQTTKPTENNTIINTISEKENINLNSNNNEPEQINVAENKEKDFDLNILNDYSEQNTEVSKEELEEKKNEIIKVLLDYQIEVIKMKATVGPTFTLFEIVQAPGVTINKIKNLEDDISLSLSSLSTRLVIPIPGKGTIGIEVPNNERNTVSFKEILEENEIKESKDSNSFTVPVGKDGENKVFNIDLSKPTYIAGTTGQGKSILMNTIISSTILENDSSEVKLVLIDTKKDDLQVFNKLNKDYIAFESEGNENTISDTQEIIDTLNKLCDEMDNRYDLLKESRSINLSEYNEKIKKGKIKGKEPLPKIILAIDEISDLMMTKGKEFEIPLLRLAQLSRAVGIHIVIATQKPSVNILTGVIKANFTNKIGTKVNSKVESRTVLDQTGAEHLTGRGDILVDQENQLTRVQTAFITEEEIKKIIDYKNKELEGNKSENTEETNTKNIETLTEEYQKAAELLVNFQHGSTSLLQRKMNIDYDKAHLIMDKMQELGIVGESQGSKPREVLIYSEEELNKLFNKIKNPENKTEILETNQSEKVSVDENKEKGEVFYMMKPVDNYFLDKNKSKINKETVYQFQLIGNGRAEFEINFLGDVSDVVKRNESYIKPACNEDNLPKEENGGKTTKIITLQKGEAELQGDKWIITKKAVIRYE